MAICKTRTMLPLDRYAKIMGINPVRFNGCGQIELSNGNRLYPVIDGVESVWPQNEWQISGNVSREEIGRLIKQAEDEIVSFLGWNPTPEWTEQEKHNLTPYINHSSGIYAASFQLDKLRFISGGQRSSVVVDDNVSVGVEDLNSDGFYETRTVTIPYPSNPLEQYKVYFAGYDGDRTYEIRPSRRKRKVGNNLVFEFDAWQLIDPEVWDLEPNEDGIGIDITDENNIVNVVDVYREYNDTSKSHVVFYTNEDGSSDVVSSGGYIVPSDNMSYIKAIPGSYNSLAGNWSSSSFSCLDILGADFWYYSGQYEYKNQSTKNEDDFISQSIAMAISYLASSRIPRDFMANNNVLSLFQDLRSDLSTPDKDTMVNVPYDLINCPFGTRKGEYRAWKAIWNFQQRRFNSATI
jgi:hypothetical protein